MSARRQVERNSQKFNQLRRAVKFYSTFSTSSLLIDFIYDFYSIIKYLLGFSALNGGCRVAITRDGIFMSLRKQSKDILCVLIL